MTALLRLFSLVFFVLSTSSYAQISVDNYPSLVIMGVSADEGSIPSSDPIYKRVADQIAQQMSTLEFPTYLEEAKTNGRFNFLDVKTDSDVIAVAKSMTDIDILVQFAIYVYLKETPQPDQYQVNARISAKLLMIGTEKFEDSFETESFEFDRVNKSCTGVCLSESIGDYASKMAQDLGNVLAEKLDHLIKLDTYSYNYAITTEHVKKPEVEKIMVFLQERQVENLSNDGKRIVFDSILPRRIIGGRLDNYFNSWSLPTRLNKNGSVFNLAVDYRSLQKPSTETKKDPLVF